jgi:hypothetical protein
VTETPDPTHDEKIARAVAAHFHHRQADDLEHCHQRRRDSSLNRWLTGVFGTVLLALLGFFAVENYRMVNARIDDQRADTADLQRTAATHERAIAEIQANQANMLAILQRIENRLNK